MGTAISFTLVAAGGTGLAASSTPKLSGSGPANEGPYPWKYPASGKVSVGSGTTIGGQKCSPGTPQLNSPYAVPCIAKFTGNNGGATYRGVTSNEIVLAQREFPNTANSEQIAAQAKAAGVAPQQVTDQVEATFLNYFNKVFDLYGRKVVIEPMTATGNSTTEALGGGQAQACADADTITNQMHAFGEDGLLINFQGGGTGPFSQCAANDKLVEFNGDAYFDEATFQSQNPYVWSTTQDCTRISSSEAEVVGTLLAGKKAVYAGDPALASQTRKFGTFVPNVKQYASCTANGTRLLEHKYHVPTAQIATPFYYNLDISTFQQSAQQAIVQFKAAGVTTVVIASDPFSAGLLTKAAAQQNYHPEWFMIGTALTDQDESIQTYYDPGEVTGHLFGMSELSPPTETTGPTSLAGKLYQKLTGHPIPNETDGLYSQLLAIFDMLQAAGPDLTPQNMARGVHALPTMGAPLFQYGTWSWNTSPLGTPGAGDHTASTDARFVYWNGGATSTVNQMKGTFEPIFNGQRFTLGHWPKSLPKLFTAAGAAATSAP
ncbi:MAG TPA: ABC transporter substrate-binding protein [Acidimicrobiales bacterium]|nr:ABC transporter substrate-binding protein [Acidimicrobiales bacterium]